MVARGGNELSRHRSRNRGAGKASPQLPESLREYGCTLEPLTILFPAAPLAPILAAPPPSHSHRHHRKSSGTPPLGEVPGRCQRCIMPARGLTIRQFPVRNRVHSRVTNREYSKGTAFGLISRARVAWSG